jgi:hypothetical protein
MRGMIKSDDIIKIKELVQKTLIKVENAFLKESDYL